MQERFKVLTTGYKIDRWLVRGGMLLCFAWMLFVVYHYDFELDSFECVAPENMVGTPCENPFYEPTTWKNLEVLEPGKYGIDRSDLLFASAMWSPLLFFVVFLVNHFWHNRGKKMVELDDTEDTDL
jgi:hypothetical protein